MSLKMINLRIEQHLPGANELNNFKPGLLELILAQWSHMVTEIWVNISSGNGLLSGSTKPLPKPLLTYHQ